MKLLPIINEILGEGLNLVKDDPISFTLRLLRDIIVTVENPDKQNSKYIGYYDEDHKLVMDEYIPSNGSFSISSERLYNPISNKYPELNRYEDVAPILRKAIEQYLNKKINDIRNVSEIEKFWIRIQ